MSNLFKGYAMDAAIMVVVLGASFGFGAWGMVKLEKRHHKKVCIPAGECSCDEWARGHFPQD